MLNCPDFSLQLLVMEARWYSYNGATMCALEKLLSLLSAGSSLAIPKDKFDASTVVSFSLCSDFVHCIL